MESQSQPSAPDPPLGRREEARRMVDRAERNWRQQVSNEQIPAPTGRTRRSAGCSRRSLSVRSFSWCFNGWARSA